MVGIAFRFIVHARRRRRRGGGPSAAGIVTLLALVGFIICFAFSMGPVVWTVINEIFPGHIRGRAVAVATAVNWGSAFLVSQSFLSLIGAIGNSLTFWLFALFCGVAWVWIYYRVPETKGQSLEQIQQLWKAAPLMLIAGDIGGTTTRLALVSPEAGPRKFVAEQEFHSADFTGLRADRGSVPGGDGRPGRRRPVSTSPAR